MTDMRQWIIDYVTGKVSKPATHRALMTCVPTGDGNLAFGLGLGCSEGWYGYTGGLPGYNTGDYYFPSKKLFILDWVDTQVNSPPPGVANAIFGDIAKIMTPNNAPFQAAKKGL